MCSDKGSKKIYLIQIVALPRGDRDLDAGSRATQDEVDRPGLPVVVVALLQAQGVAALLEAATAQPEVVAAMDISEEMITCLVY